LAAAATVTPRRDPTKSQDRVAAISASSGRSLAAVVVADGLGSLPESGRAAQRAVDACAAAWVDGTRSSEAGPIDVVDLHHAIVGELGGEGSTTLLTAEATASHIEVTWVGNGGLLWFVEAPTSYSSAPVAIGPDGGPNLPIVGSDNTVLWTDLSLPHISFRDGRDLLREVVGGLRPPRQDSIRVSRGIRASVVIAVSDGLFSREHIEVGSTSDGESWMRLSPQVRSLERLAGELLAQQRRGLLRSDQVVEDACRLVLGELLAAGRLDDDASLAVLVVPPRPHPNSDADRLERPRATTRDPAPSSSEPAPASDTPPPSAARSATVLPLSVEGSGRRARSKR
jgi:hypothetical protein